MSPRVRGILVAIGMSPIWICAYFVFVQIYVLDEDIKYNWSWIYEHYWRFFFYTITTIALFPSVTTVLRIPLRMWYWKGSKYAKEEIGIKSEYVRAFTLLKEIYEFESSRENRFIQEMMDQ